MACVDTVEVNSGSNWVCGISHEDYRSSKIALADVYYHPFDLLEHQIWNPRFLIKYLLLAVAVAINFFFGGMWASR